MKNWYVAAALAAAAALAWWIAKALLLWVTMD